MTTGRRQGVSALAALRRHTAIQLDKGLARVAAIQRLLATGRMARDRLVVDSRSVADTPVVSARRVDRVAMACRIEYLADVQRRIAHCDEQASRQVQRLERERRNTAKIHERLAALDRYRDNDRRGRLVDATAREMRSADSEWLARIQRAEQPGGHEGSRVSEFRR